MNRRHFARAFCGILTLALGVCTAYAETNAPAAATEAAAKEAAAKEAAATEAVAPAAMPPTATDSRRPAPPPAPDALIRHRRPLPVLPPPPPDWEFVSRMTFERFPGVKREDVIRFLDEIFPGEMQNIRKASSTKPDLAMDALATLAHQGIEILKKRKENPELFAKQLAFIQLERKAVALGAALRTAESKEDRAARAAELQTALRESFEIKQELMQADLEELMRGVERLRTLVEKREEHRQAIINRRIAELTGNGEWLQW